jgi:hypothetical protein
MKNKNTQALLVILFLTVMFFSDAYSGFQANNTRQVAKNSITLTKVNIAKPAIFELMRNGTLEIQRSLAMKTRKTIFHLLVPSENHLNVRKQF